MTGLLLIGPLVLLALFLLLARRSEARNEQQSELLYDRLLSSRGQEVLEYLTNAVDEHRAGLEACGVALAVRDVERIKMATEAVELFAPGLTDGLRATRAMLRAISVMVPLPPVAPWVWRAWELRGLSGLTGLVHNLLVSGVERARLRVWLLARALSWSLRRLRTGADAVVLKPAAWRSIEIAVADLATVGDEAELTYGRVVRALDVVGRFAPATVVAQ